MIYKGSIKGHKGIKVVYKGTHKIYGSINQTKFGLDKIMISDIISKKLDDL